MKNNRDSFSDEEIKKLKLHFNLAEIARLYDISPTSNIIYRSLRKFPVNKYSKSYKFIQDLEDKLNKINAK